MGEKVTVIRGATALIGRDLVPVQDSIVVIDGQHISAIGRGAEVTAPPGAEVVDARGLTVLPGFIDSHVHIAFANPFEVVSKGVTTARDLAWAPDDIWPLVRRSRGADFRGPRLIAAGQMLTVRDGYPLRAAWAAPHTGRAVSGPPDAEAAVAEQAKQGAAIIKVALNRDAGPTMDVRTLRAIVDAAHERGLDVTAHVSGLDELRKALDAGVEELAHMLMSPERIPETTIDRMVEQNVTVVPTLSVRFGKDRRVAIHNLRRFAEAGGRVIYGTDLGNQGPRPGIDAREIAGMAKAGMTPRQIIASATVDAAGYLELHDTGVLARGSDADIIAVRGDPLADVGVLADARMVWRNGRRLR